MTLLALVLFLMVVILLILAGYLLFLLQKRDEQLDREESRRRTLQEQVHAARQSITKHQRTAQRALALVPEQQRREILAGQETLN